MKQSQWACRDFCILLFGFIYGYLDTPSQAQPSISNVNKHATPNTTQMNNLHLLNLKPSPSKITHHLPEQFISLSFPLLRGRRRQLPIDDSHPQRILLRLLRRRLDLKHRIQRLSRAVHATTTLLHPVPKPILIWHRQRRSRSSPRPPRVGTRRPARPASPKNTPPIVLPYIPAQSQPTTPTPLMPMDLRQTRPRGSSHTTISTLTLPPLGTILLQPPRQPFKYLIQRPPQHLLLVSVQGVHPIPPSHTGSSRRSGSRSGSSRTPTRRRRRGTAPQTV